MIIASQPKVDKTKNTGKISLTLMIKIFAEVAELADALGSGLSEHCAREGSSPSFGTGTNPALNCGAFYLTRA